MIEKANNNTVGRNVVNEKISNIGAENFTLGTSCGTNSYGSFTVDQNDWMRDKEPSTRLFERSIPYSLIDQPKKTLVSKRMATSTQSAIKASIMVVK